MVDNERENLANARRKLKKFRDQQQQPDSVESNGNNVQPLSGSTEPAFHQPMLPPHPAQFIPDALVVPNGIGLNPSRSPVPNFVNPSRQNGSPSDHQKPDRTRPDNQRLSSGGSNTAHPTSRRSSQTSVDSEQKLRRDNEHLQEQLEVHVQTIGILVAEKTDTSAKLTQSFKQLERKQSEMDELYGRLKASRERVQELEKEIQNSTSNVQKREMAAKESDKENDRLKIENIRQSQSIEDLKQNINQLNEKLRDRQTHFEQVNTELQQVKAQSQSNHDASLAQQLTQKNSQLEELVSSINRIRSDNEQYQQYNSNMQQHIQELTGQINQLTETNAALEKQQNEMRLSDQHSTVAHDDLQQENHLLRNAIDQWSNRYEDLRVKLEQMTKLSMEKDEQIAASKVVTPLDPLPSRTYREDETQTDIPHSEPPAAPIADPTMTERNNQLISENVELKDRNQELEHVVQQLQSETETIGDYIRLYQQQREQLQKRYQEKDDSTKELAQERWNFQKKLSELHDLLIHGLNIPSSSSTTARSSLETTNNPSEQSSSLGSPALNDEVKTHVLSLIKAWREKQTFSPISDVTSSVKVAYTDQTVHRCSTCSGSVQWV